MPQDTAIERTEAPQPTVDISFSQSVGKLAGALAKASKKFKAVKKTSSNPFFKSKYADLAEVLDATVYALSDNELAVVQSPGTYNDGIIHLHTILLHSSGEWIKGTLQMPVSKHDAQGVGSAITYARRYAYSAIVDVASESDDDGNAASSKGFEKHKEEPTETEFDQLTEGQRRIAGFQVKAFWDAAKKVGKSDAQVEAYLKGLGIVQVEELTRQMFNDAIKWASAPIKLPADLTEKLLESVHKTDKAGKFSRVYAAAKKRNIPESDWRQAMTEIYHKEHLTELSPEQFDGLVKWVEEVGA